MKTKKGLKRLAALVLALCMCMGLCATTFGAEGDAESYSITISNSIAGSTYNAYKIFDVTYDSQGNYSYTVSSDSAWYSLFTDEKNATLSEYSMPFTFTATTGAAGEGNVIYNVTVAEKSDTEEPYSDEEIIGYLKAAIATIATYDEDNKTWSVSDSYKVAGTAQGNNGSVTISLEDDGYYFVTTTTGSIVSITTADPDATIIDKQTPPPDIEKVIVHEDGSSDSAEADGMGEDVSFDVTATVPITETITGEDGTETYNYVTDYEITDSMTNGLLIELNENDFYQGSDGKYYLSDDKINEWITLNDGAGQELTFTDYVYNYSFELIGYDVYTDDTTGKEIHTFSGFVLTYYTYNVEEYKEDLANALTAAGYDKNDVWPDYPDGWPDASQIGENFDFPSESYFENSNYPANATIEIAYTAHVSSLEGYENTNTIYMDHHVTPFNHPVPWQPTPGPQKFARDYVYSWELQIVKVDGEDEETPLEGATFTLSSDNMKDVKVGHSYLYVPLSLFDENGVYTDSDGTAYNLVNFESTHYVLQNDTYVVGEGADDNYTYVRILTSDASVEDTTTTHTATATTDENGMIYFEGLGTGVYTLTEITAPDGYNLLDAPIIFEITFKETGDETTGYEGAFTVTYGTLDEDGDFVPNSGDGTTLADNYIMVETIENNSGTELPGTGGMGTTIFYIIGIIIVAGAAILLVTRRRMNRAA